MDKDERVIAEANFIVDNEATIREAAAVLGISKSTVHLDMSIKLPQLNKKLHAKVSRVLENNKAERHIRGGISTRERWKKVLN